MERMTLSQTVGVRKKMSEKTWGGKVMYLRPVEFQIINMQFTHGRPHSIGEPNADRWKPEK